MPYRGASSLLCGYREPQKHLKTGREGGKVWMWQLEGKEWTKKAKDNPLTKGKLLRTMLQ